MEIRQCAVSEFFEHPDAAALLAEYAEESAMAGLPTPCPNQEIYEILEKAGIMSVLVATEGEVLLGFLVLLVSLNPHYSVFIGVSESYFVAAQHRNTGAGTRLRQIAEQLAAHQGAKGLLISSPAGGKLEAVLSRTKEYAVTNTVFFRSLN